MTNAERLLLRLDALLDAPVDLTLYGRAALALGYPLPKPEFARSMDVDAVLWLGQAELLERSGNFWEALDRLNAEFEASGLYMTHLFDETQVILSPDWRIQRVPIPLGTTRLSISRLADADLMLSKLMRYDPIDLDDLRFIVTASGLSPEAVARAIGSARVPDSDEIREQLALCRTWLTSQALCAAG